MIKKINFSSEAREKLKTGVNIVGDTVGQTLGAKGQNVIIDKGMFPPFITNDGVTIAKEIELEDRFEHMGAALIKEAANNTNEVAGDGTTTSVVLAQSIINEGFKNIAAGANPMILKKGIEQATKEVIAQLRSMSKEVKGDDIENVATISSGDPEVGKIIAEVMKKVGTDGVVTVQEGHKIGLVSEVTDGMRFENGSISPYFMTDIPRMEAIHEDAYILITDKRISSESQVFPIIDTLMRSGHKQLLIIAEDVDGSALTALVQNKLSDVFKSIAVRAPGFGERRKDYLEDIAVLTGGVLITESTGLKLEEMTIADLGRANRIIVTKDTTTISGAKGAKKQLDNRLKQIKNQLESEKNEYDREKLKDRYAKLSGGIGVIKVGAATEVEMKERKYRIEDALNATKAATDKEDGGILPGGGAALAKVILDIPNTLSLDPDFATGLKIIQNACFAPLRRIVENAGGKPDVVVDEVRNNVSESLGYNVLTGNYVDMFEEGIIDPLKVTVTAFTNASSVAQMLLTTGAVVVEKQGKGE